MGVTLNKKEVKYISLGDSKIEMNDKVVEYLIRSNKTDRYIAVGMKTETDVKQLDLLFTEENKTKLKEKFEKELGGRLEHG